MHPRLLGRPSFLSALVLIAIAQVSAQSPAQPPLGAVKARYTKYEYQIPMRDGVKLFTAVYVPKDTAQPYPIMLTRTPYSVAPYGVDHFRASLGPSPLFSHDGFVFAYQDVRGRYMSEGEFVEMRPTIPREGPRDGTTKRGPTDIDEATDTYDTIAWLIANVPNNNGRVGLWGISYPGFYAAAGVVDAHPALKAASPQAPIADLYMGDDSYHNGAFMLAANFGFYTNFTRREGGPQKPVDGPGFSFGTPDGYDFYLRLGPIGRSNAVYFNGANPYWNDNLAHTSYDAFWKARALPPHLKNVTPAVLTVGGWFDAEDLAGPLAIYRAIEDTLGPAEGRARVKGEPLTKGSGSAKTSNGHFNALVMGPWGHGGWSRNDGDRLGNLSFGSATSAYYREQIEFPFFAHYLKDRPLPDLPEASVFETGSNQWRRYDTWPPKDAQATTFYLGANGTLSSSASAASSANAPAFASSPSAPGTHPSSRTGSAGASQFDEYISDPNRPVPYLGYTALGMTRDYMTEDQRFASRRPDVLVYQTEPLDDDVTIVGPVKVDLHVSTSGTDADWIVKVIDVYPGTYATPSASAATTSPGSGPAPANAVKMGGYQQLVRGEPFRGKFRHGFEKPEPFTPHQPARVTFTMPDVAHTFRKGHRLMVQVQSSWFPLIDRNPQTFVDIPNAKPSDFQKATHRIYRSRQLASSITVQTMGARTTTVPSSR